VRKVILYCHLYLGLIGAVFVVVLGLTGAAIAFEDRYDEWLHPTVWRVTPQGERLKQQQLVELIEQRFRPARVEELRISSPARAEVFTLRDHRVIFVNPYSGEVLEVRDHALLSAQIVSKLHQLHVALAYGYTGRQLVDYVNIEVGFLLLTGLYLWWRKKRLRISWRKSWSRINWDLHNVIGIYVAAFGVLMVVTGFFIGFEKALYWVTRTAPTRMMPTPHSVLPQSLQPDNAESSAIVNGTPKIADLDLVVQSADNALPGVPICEIDLPRTPRATYQIWKRSSSATSGSTVYVDQYSGQVLRVDDARNFSNGFRLYEMNQALHAGRIFGLPTQIVMSCSSLLLAVLSITGVIMGWRKPLRTFRDLWRRCRTRLRALESTNSN